MSACHKGTTYVKQENLHHEPHEASMDGDLLEDGQDLSEATCTASQGCTCAQTDKKPILINQELLRGHEVGVRIKGPSVNIELFSPN